MTSKKTRYIYFIFQFMKNPKRKMDDCQNHATVWHQSITGRKQRPTIHTDLVLFISLTLQTKAIPSTRLHIVLHSYYQVASLFWQFIIYSPQPPQLKSQTE